MNDRAETFATSERSKVRRQPERGSAARDDVLAILAEGLVCTVAFVDDGRPVAIPMTYGLMDGDLILHGSPGSRLMRRLTDGRDVCVTVTLVDGLVLARSAFHSSMNYRSVVVFARGRIIPERAEKHRALDALVEHLIPGRTAEARPMSDSEIDGTAVIALKIDEATAKVRVGPPTEPEGDVSYPVWAGVIPLVSAFGEAIPAPDLAAGFEAPTIDRSGSR